MTFTRGFFTCVAAGAATYLTVSVVSGHLNIWQAMASLTRPAVFGIAIALGLGLRALVRRLWRAARGINVESVGRAAGAAARTSASAQARFKSSFMAERDR
jgi:ABC-type Co2+ transport system permease subunit